MKKTFLIVLLLLSCVFIFAQINPWLWAINAGGSNNDYCYSIGVDASGNIYVTGYFQGTATFGSNTLTSNGSSDIFIAKLDSSGNWLWARNAGGSSRDIAMVLRWMPVEIAMLQVILEVLLLLSVLLL